MAQCIAEYATTTVRELKDQDHSLIIKMMIGLLNNVGMIQQMIYPISRTCRPIASGGFATVYKVDNVAWKVFHSPAHFLIEMARTILLLT